MTQFHQMIIAPLLLPQSMVVSLFTQLRHKMRSAPSMPQVHRILLISKWGFLITPTISPFYLETLPKENMRFKLSKLNFKSALVKQPLLLKIAFLRLDALTLTMRKGRSMFAGALFGSTKWVFSICQENSKKRSLIYVLLPNHRMGRFKFYPINSKTLPSYR